MDSVQVAEPIHEMAHELTMKVLDDYNASPDSQIDYPKIEQTALRFAQERVGEQRVSSYLFSLSKALHELHQSDSELEVCLVAAVCCCRVARDLSTQSSDQMAILWNLSVFSNELFDYVGKKGLLDEAIDTAKLLLFLEDEDLEEVDKLELFCAATEMLAFLLDRRFVEYQSREDLIEAKMRVQEALQLNPERYRRASLLHILSMAHERHFDQSGRISTLQTSIRVAKEALQSVIGSKTEEAAAMASLSQKYQLLYSHSFMPEHLEKSVKYVRDAISDSTPQTAPDFWGKLSQVLLNQFDRHPQAEVINEAIDAACIADQFSARDGTSRAENLVHLAMTYLTRYCHYREWNDLKESIARSNEAIWASPEGSSIWVRSSYGLLLGMSVEVRRTKKNCDETIQLGRELIHTPHVNDGIRCSSIACVSSLIQHQYKQQYEGMKDCKILGEAIDLLKDAIGKTPDGDRVLRTILQDSLGRVLLCKYNQSKNLSTLEQAIASFREAAQDVPSKLSTDVTCTQNLAAALDMRFEHVGEVKDRQESFEHFISGAYKKHGDALDRIQCGRAAIAILVNRGEWNVANRLGEDMLKLIPLACGRYSSRHDQQHIIAQTAGLAADAASLMIRVGDSDRALDRALEQLESGRGLILSYTIDSRSDIWLLENADRNLASRYKNLLAQLEASEPSLANTSSTKSHPALDMAALKNTTNRARMRREAIANIDACLEEIRRIPGLERFQMALEISELRELASEGPLVLVNFSRISADALIVTTQHVHSLRLPAMNFDTAPELARQQLFSYVTKHRGDSGGSRDIEIEDEATNDPMSHLCSWLWTNCVKLIIEKLEHIGAISSNPDEYTRVWWIGSGAASSFPFHAAGTDFSPGSRNNTLARITPSYTPTIKALKYSRSRAAIPMSGPDQDPSMLLVTMPKTPGHSDLPGVHMERIAIEQVCKGFYKVQSAEFASASAVLDILPQASIVHFACHGSLDRSSPMQSHLLLEKEERGKRVLDKLTMLDVTNVAANNRLSIAFFSACSSADVKGSELADESLHMASAAQLAGYPNVIGTLWPTRDDMCASVAKEFYSELKRFGQRCVAEENVAVALRRAIVSIRNENGGSPAAWGPFIHSGA